MVNNIYCYHTFDFFEKHEMKIPALAIMIELW